MNENRLKEILNNILVEIVNTSDMDKETYISWLKNEIGITAEELMAFNQDGFILPVPYEAEPER